ncbi:Bug family tripartite tricarboxylate transporter substrate binding protein [Comamonas antarctica]|uniref:Tripartite tricarboxylate transporter substrate binding protein n=1 Tax=Comamonas antarctica TaxID=2743470 RepID=A0A6N1X8T1_9BURK|nr:tripartite tricarboxylate transporter substrate binding protein [Comamonas antarctica]QKV55771.1 tripartite tricarboxylate transporter substrate binding protein [Comamonas antarctica]
MKRHASRIAAAVLLLSPFAAYAEWPNRPIKIIVPFPAGNSSDVSMRILGEKLGARLGQPVVIENRIGAGGTIGTAAAAKATPDGYTLAMGSTGPLSIAQWLRPDSMPYNPAKDFAVLGAVAYAPQVLTVRSSLPVANFKEFLAYGRQSGNKLNYGSSGNGTTPHLVIAQLVSEARLNAEHIPFQGGSQALTSLVGEQIDFISDNVPVIQGAISSGRVKPLAVSSAKRIPSMPDIPTIAEQGVPGFDYQGWILLVGPSKLPAAIATRLNTEVEAIMKMPEVRQRFGELGLAPMDMPKSELAGFLAAESKKWQAAVKVSNAIETTR